MRDPNFLQVEVGAAKLPIEMPRPVGVRFNKRFQRALLYDSADMLEEQL